MDQQTFRNAVLLLSGDHSLSILRALRDGRWRLSSEVAGDLGIHITTASKFLHRLSELGLIEHRPHDSRTFEYRLRNARLKLEVDLADDAGPLREIVDFYVAYFHALFERIRFHGAPDLRREMERRLTTDHEELRQVVFDQVVAGAGGGLEQLRELVATVHRDLWSVCSQGLGASTARSLFQGALSDAITIYPDLATRCGLAGPLEA